MRISFGSAAITACILLGLAVEHNAVRADDNTPLTQKQAENLLSRIYINNCDPDTKFSETVKMGAADHSGKVRGHYGPITIYPVQNVVEGSCVYHAFGRTDWAEVSARYTTNFYRNNFGEWAHTPVTGICNYKRTAYQMQGQARLATTDAQTPCTFAEKQ